jgi:predicted nucleotidyltransferase
MLYVAGQPVDQTRLAALCEQYGVGRLLVFGSAARGDMSPGSDVDVPMSSYRVDGSDGN